MELKYDRTTVQNLLKLYDVLCRLKKGKNKLCVQTLTMGSYPPSNIKIKSESTVSRQERMSQLVPAVENRKPSKKDAMCDCCDLCFCYSQEDICVKKHGSQDLKRKRSSDRRASSADMPIRHSSDDFEPLIERKRSSSDQSVRRRLSSQNISEIIHKAASERSLASVKSDTRLSTGSEDEEDQKIIDQCDLDEGRCKADAECKCCKFCKCYKEEEETKEPKKQSKKSMEQEESPKRVSNKIYFDENYNRYKEISDSFIEESPPKPPPKKQTPVKSKKKANVKKSKKGAKKERQKSITPSRENLHSHSYHRLENHYLTTVKSDSSLSLKSDENLLKSESDSDKKTVKKRFSSDSVKSTDSEVSESSPKPKNPKTSNKRESEKSNKSKKSVKSCPANEEVASLKKGSDESVETDKRKMSKKRESEKSNKSKKSVKSCPANEEVASLKKDDSDDSNDPEKLKISKKPEKSNKSKKSVKSSPAKEEVESLKKVDSDGSNDKEKTSRTSPAKLENTKDDEFKGSIKRIAVRKGGCDVFPLNKKIRQNAPLTRRFNDDSSIAAFVPQDACCVPRYVPRIPTCPSPCLPPPCCNPCPPLCTYNLSADSLPKQISESSLYFMNKKPKIFCKTIVTSKGQVTICRSDKSKNKKWDFTKKGMKCISYEAKDPDSKVTKKSEICFETEEDLVRALFAARNFKKKLQKSWNSHHRIEDKKPKFKHFSDFKVQPLINKSDSPKDNSFYYPKSYVKRVKNFKNIQRKPLRRTQFTKGIQVDKDTKQTKNMAIQTIETENIDSKDACTSYDNVSSKSPKVSFSDQNELKNYKIIVRIPTPETSETKKVEPQEKGIIDLFLNQTAKKEDVSKVEDIIKNLFDTLFVQKAEQLIREIEEKAKHEKKNVPLIQGSQIKMIRAFEQIYGNRRKVEKKSTLSFGGIDVLNSTVDSDLKSEVLERKDSKDKISINLFERFKYLDKDSIETKTKNDFEEKSEKPTKEPQNEESNKLYANTGHKDWKSDKEQKPKLDKTEGFRFKMDSNLGLGIPKDQETQETKKIEDGGQKNFLNVIKLALEEYEKETKEKNVIANPVEISQKNDFSPTKWQMTKSMENTLKQTSLAPFLNLEKDEKKKKNFDSSVKAKGDQCQTLVYPCLTSLVQNNLPIWTIDSYLNSLQKLSKTLDTQLVQIKQSFDSKLDFLFEKKELNNEKTSFIQKELIELKDKIKQNPFLELRREISSNKSLKYSEQNRLLASIDSEVKKLNSIEERVNTIIEDLKNNVENDSKQKSREKNTNSKLCVLRLEQIGQILQKELINIQSILSEKEEFPA